MKNTGHIIKDNISSFNIIDFSSFLPQRFNYLKNLFYLNQTKSLFSGFHAKAFDKKSIEIFNTWRHGVIKNNTNILNDYSSYPIYELVKLKNKNNKLKIFDNVLAPNLTITKAKFIQSRILQGGQLSNSLTNYHQITYRFFDNNNNNFLIVFERREADNSETDNWRIAYIENL